METNRTIKDDRNNRIKRTIVNRNNNQVISSTSIPSSQFDDPQSRFSNSARFVDAVNTKVFNTETLSQVTTSNYNNNEKQISSFEPKTVTELAESLNITNIKEILEDDDSLFPDTDTSISRYIPKNRSKLTNPTNYITIINNHYYVDSENSSIDSDEDFLNYNDDYTYCGDSNKPDFDVGEPMILVYSYRNRGGQSTNENTFSSTDSSESPVRRSKQRCKIIELSSPNINSERLPTPIPDQYYMANLNRVNEGVLPIVTEVTEDASTDNNTKIKEVLENTWISRNQDISEETPNKTQVENVECKCKEETKFMKWDILPQRIRKRLATHTNPTDQKGINEAKLSKETSYEFDKPVWQTNAKGIPQLNNKNINRNLISKDNKFIASRGNTPRRAKEEISFQKKLTLQSPAKPSNDYDSISRPNTARGNTPVKHDMDVGNLKVSFRDKLIARAKARKEILEAALDAQEKWSHTTFDVQEKAENFKQHQENNYGERVTGIVNKKDLNWDKIVKQNNARTLITARKLRQNSAPSKIYQKEFNSPRKFIKKNQEIESKLQSSNETKHIVKVSKHQKSCNMNVRTNSTQTTISQNKSEKNSLLIQEKSTQTTVKTNVLKQDLDETHIHDKILKDRVIKLKKGKYKKDQLFEDNQNEKSLICLYHRPDETYAEGFNASNIALYGSSREINMEIENITPDEIGCNKLLYRNINFLKSPESSEYSLHELVTARSMKSVVETKPWWRMFTDCFKSCKLNYIFRK